MRVTRFDRVVAGLIAALLAGLAVVILVGDRVGVQIVRAAPLATARSTSPIVWQFDEPMTRDSVIGRVRITPPIVGEYVWNRNDTLTLRPREPLTPGTAYTVALEAGAQAESGRLTLSEVQFTFTVQPPRVAYLAPADSATPNIFLADPANPDAPPQQITFSPSGIYDFAASPDGSVIVFAESTTNGTNDLKSIDLATGALQQLTNCVTASCTTPVWSPDGTRVAYERVEYDTGIGSGASPTRVWLLDMATTPPTTRPLFQQSQILGHSAQWSADSQRIAVYDPASVSILVYDFAADSTIAVPSTSGSSGALSPDGSQMVYTATTVVENAGTRSYFTLTNLTARTMNTPYGTDAAFDDARAAWSPDGTQLAVARRYIDDRYTRGHQIALVNPADFGAEPRLLTDDPRYANLFFAWSPTGTDLVIQRYPELDENMQPNSTGRPEIWTVNAASSVLTRLAVNGYLPRWVP